jgi:hypothetical protein
MLGATGVGKTSLIRRFVKSIYSEKYHTTIGVKIDKKQLSVKGQEIMLLLWDVQGEDEEFKIRPSFLRGASGYLLVVDLTRPETLQTAFSVKQMVETEFAPLPFILVLNKSDLTEEIKISEADQTQIAIQNIAILTTSAKNGDNVDNAFGQLSEMMI